MKTKFFVLIFWVSLTLNPGLPKCPQMQTSSQRRHLYKEKPLATTFSIQATMWTNSHFGLFQEPSWSHLASRLFSCPYQCAYQIRKQSDIEVFISPNEVFSDIMVLASPPPRPPPPVDPDDVNTLNSINIQPISFKFYMWVDTPLRYFAIEIWYSPGTRTTAFTAKWHEYPPNLQNAISP